jgi:hypothetical protein
MRRAIFYLAGAAAITMSIWMWRTWSAERSSAPPEDSSFPAEEAVAAPYPPGKWRSAPPPDLSRSVVWVSCILIRHNESKRQMLGSSAPWPISTPNPQRSRAEAWRLARELAARAKARPSDFAELARRHSDDVATASRGGSLGTLRASELFAWPTLLDAIESLPPGHVSEPIEVGAGVAILQRNPAPSEQRLSGAHIVVSHDDVRWLRLLGVSVPQRTVQQAWSRAREIHRQLISAPDRFGEIAAAESDHPDKARGGDLGSWSTLEPTHMPRVLETLRMLDIGEIAEPFETAFGIEIVRRIEDFTRPAYAMQALHFGYDPRVPDAHAAAWAKASSFSLQLHAEPQRFDALVLDHCCKDVVTKVEGRHDQGLILALRGLPVGAIADQPITADGEVLIPRRMALEAAPPSRPVILGLPN